jgi:hypothetical protein
MSDTSTETYQKSTVCGQPKKICKQPGLVFGHTLRPKGGRLVTVKTYGEPGKTTYFIMENNFVPVATFIRSEK